MRGHLFPRIQDPLYSLPAARSPGCSSTFLCFLFSWPGLCTTTPTNSPFCRCNSGLYLLRDITIPLNNAAKGSYVRLFRSNREAMRASLYSFVYSSLVFSEAAIRLADNRVYHMRKHNANRFKGGPGRAGCVALLVVLVTV